MRMGWVGRPRLRTCSRLFGELVSGVDFAFHVLFQNGICAEVHSVKVEALSGGCLALLGGQLKTVTLDLSQFSALYPFVANSRVFPLSLGV
jgi:hypothetical protein